MRTGCGARASSPSFIDQPKPLQSLRLKSTLPPDASVMKCLQIGPHCLQRPTNKSILWVGSQTRLLLYTKILLIPRFSIRKPRYLSGNEIRYIDPLGTACKGQCAHLVDLSAANTTRGTIVRKGFVDTLRPSLRPFA